MSSARADQMEGSGGRRREKEATPSAIARRNSSSDHGRRATPTTERPSGSRRSRARLYRAGAIFRRARSPLAPKRTRVSGPGRRAPLSPSRSGLGGSSSMAGLPLAPGVDGVAAELVAQGGDHLGREGLGLARA